MGDTVEVPLSKGMVALVDFEDLGQVAAHRWQPVAGRATAVIYASTSVRRPDGFRTTIRMHRLIMAAGPGQMIDHINFNGLDNRRANLRFTDGSKNVHHHRKAPTAESAYKGVTLNPGNGRWRARLRLKGERVSHLGYFDSELEAALAYDRAAVEQLGPYASTNFPQVNR